MDLAYILIDDSELDCFIAKKIIEQNNEDASISIYRDAGQALQAISNTLNTALNVLTVILLDLRMPVMNGFQFIEEFEKLPQYIQQQYAVFILSSTKNEIDRNRALGYHTVINALQKPFTKITLESVFVDLRNRLF